MFIFIWNFLKYLVETKSSLSKKMMVMMMMITGEKCAILQIMQDQASNGLLTGAKTNHQNSSELGSSSISTHWLQSSCSASSHISMLKCSLSTYHMMAEYIALRTAM